MKIGIFSSIQGRGGTERITYNLARFFKERGFDVEILTWKDYKSFEYDIPKKCLSSKRIPPFDNIWLSPLIHSRKGNFDVFFNFIFAGSLFISKLINRKTPVVQYFHKPPLEIVTIKDKITFFPIVSLEKMHKYLKNIKTCCNSKYTQKRIRDFYEINPKVVYSCIELDRFKPSKRKRDYILMVGRITPFKKYHEILDMFLSRNEKIVLAGSIGDRDYYNSIKRKYPFVKILTSVSDKELIKLYQDCKLFIFTNPNEHFGLVPFEAMACDKTVLVPIGCGASELITDGKDGYLFKADHSDFYEKLERALKHDTGRRARKTVEKTLSVEVFGNKILKLIQ